MGIVKGPVADIIIREAAGFDGKQLIVKRATLTARRKKFEAAQEWAHGRYGKAFKKLAE